MEERDARQGILKVGSEGRRRLLRAVREEVQAVSGHRQSKFSVLQTVFELYENQTKIKRF